MALCPLSPLSRRDRRTITRGGFSGVLNGLVADPIGTGKPPHRRALSLKAFWQRLQTDSGLPGKRACQREGCGWRAGRSAATMRHQALRQRAWFESTQNTPRDKYEARRERLCAHIDARGDRGTMNITSRGCAEGSDVALGRRSRAEKAQWRWHSCKRRAA
jgi:hypothetical protein